MSEAPTNSAQQPVKDELANISTNANADADVEMKSEPVKEEEPPLPEDVVNATPEE